MFVACGRKFLNNSLLGGVVVFQGKDGLFSELVGTGFTNPWCLRSLKLNNGEDVLFFIDAIGYTPAPLGGKLMRFYQGAWEEIGVPNYFCYNVYIDGTRLWALFDLRSDADIGNPSSEGTRVYLSEDLGSTWTHVYTLAGGEFLNRKPFGYAIVASGANVVVLGVETVGWRVRFWKSTDGGSTWSFIVPTAPTSWVSVQGRNKALVVTPSQTFLSVLTPTSGTAYICASSDLTSWSIVVATNSGANRWSARRVCGRTLFFNDDSSLHPGVIAVRDDLSVDYAHPPPAFGAVACHDNNLLVGRTYTSGTVTNNDVPYFLMEGDHSSSPNFQSLSQRLYEDLGFYLAPGREGILGDVVPSEPEIPEPPPDGTPVGPSPCVPIISVSPVIDATGIYSRVRSYGLGINNASEDTSALIPQRETDWDPQQGYYIVRRELQINDYGVTEGEELRNLAYAHLTDPSAKLRGFTSLRVVVPSLPSDNTTGKPLQPGDTIVVHDTIAAAYSQSNEWVVDEYVYKWPEDITEIIASQKSAAMLESAGGNVRIYGAAFSSEGEYWESDWIPPLQVVGGKLSCVEVIHRTGVVPSRILVIAADRPIENWWDDEEVSKNRILFVPPLHEDPTWGPTGYTVVFSDGYSVVLGIAATLMVTRDKQFPEAIFSAQKTYKVLLFP
jgi:hypothetical protein